MLVTALLVAGIFSSALAACTADAMMPEAAQMACCEAGHHTCGQDGAPADCCKTNSTPQQKWNTVARTEAPKVPFRVFLAHVTLPNPLSNIALVVQSSRQLSASPPVQPLGPPVYIVFSSLLI
jgi:hypothetical protein